jgi:aspartate aminotransferase
MLAPGPGFYQTPGKGKQEVRIAYVLAEKKLLRATQILKKALTVYVKLGNKKLD